jgi:vacuolar-type H+-ATPase subunit F/Vma7
MSKFALIADEMLLPPLALSGVKVFPGQTAEKFSAAVSEISADGGYKMVFVTEDAAEIGMEQMEQASASGLNMVIIPGQGKKNSFFQATLNNLTMKVTGAG